MRQRIISFIFLGEATGDITNTCRVFNLSRTIYYEWLRRFNQFGYLGLMDKQKSKPRMHNQIKPDFEVIIDNYITEYPTHWPRRISDELKVQSITISETGVSCTKKSKPKPSIDPSLLCPGALR